MQIWRKIVKPKKHFIIAEGSLFAHFSQKLTGILAKTASF